MNTFISNTRLITLLILLIAYGCKKEQTPEEENLPDNITNMDDLIADENFNFKTTKEIDITIYAKDNQNNPVKGVRINIYTGMPEEGGISLMSGITNQSGVYKTKFPIATYYSEIVVTTPHIGFPPETKVPVGDGCLELTLGGGAKSGYKSSGGFKATNSVFHYMGTYDDLGVPDYLEPVNDVIDAQMLADINAALPENLPVPQYHPEYLAEDNETSIIVTEDAEIWVTFVHEGALFTNALGYFLYDTLNPPVSPDDIDTITIVYPNFSYADAGGGLVPGNKVFLGVFPANTCICWVLIANGWDGNQVQDVTKYYSEPQLNPESDPNLKQHNVALYDAVREIFLIGFEDIKRSYSSCDNDFNDAIFYITANPVEAIQNSNMPWVNPEVIDTDGDGVHDVDDDYPLDPTKAFNNYYPGEGQYGSLAFEDLWPDKGDYDFNDVVLDYNINQITNADNKVVEIEESVIVRASGAGYRNGFGFELQIAPPAVQDVTGFNLQEGFINLEGNNVESNQQNATIIVFDNLYNLFDDISGGWLNTDYNIPYRQPESLTVVVSLANPLEIATLGLPPYNPFIIVNKERGREVHLPGYTPTSLADTSYFGTGDDDTNPAIGKYYKSDNNLPWGANLPVSFDYPLEQEQILKGYLVFDSWVLSGGLSYMDWYLDNPGYRANEYIYQVP